MSGPAGFAHSTIPVIVFVTANAFLSLPITIGVAVATGLVLFAYRTLCGSGSRPRSGARSGSPSPRPSSPPSAQRATSSSSASGRRWPGFVGTLGSVLARRPQTGVVWNAVHGGKDTWRDDRAVLRAHDLATLGAALVFGSRFAVQLWLYVAVSTGGLGIARVATGMPLTILAALVVEWAFRRSTMRLRRSVV